MTDVVSSEGVSEQFWLDIRGIKSPGEGISLSESQVQALLRPIGIEGSATITIIHEYNHVYRIECANETLFLKLFTKSWYVTPEESSASVEHERSAWSILASHGIAAPDVLIANQEHDNLLGMPFILTRKIQGEALDLLLRQVPQQEISALLYTVGSYLRSMHAIPFAYPGYLTGDGPTQFPNENEWQFGIWTAQQCQEEIRVWIASMRPTLSDAVAQRLEQRIATIAQELAPEYEPLHFVHGDCHLEQFFLQKDNDQWRVNGVVDMEVASSGASAADIVYVCRELAQALPSQTRWWESLFEGYGSIPNFERFRLRLLNCWYPYGPDIWPGSGDNGFTHLLNATSWDELFSDTHLIV